MSEPVAPFRVDTTDAELSDLRERLARTRWPEPEPVGDWSQGIPLAYVQDLCRYWERDYDLSRLAARLNARPQFRTEIAGLGIHFLHARSPHPDALPLLITHGWPGSVVEFLDVIDPLVDPPRHGGERADAFHVICPSLPGYGYSDKPAEPGFGHERIAAAWAELMARLGYARYGAQGGDWGAFVTMKLGQIDADHLAGVHLNMPLASPDALGRFDELTEAEQAALHDFEHYRRWDSGYAEQQSTRPQTLGYGLVDSPAAQLAWIIEKFWSWTDSGGHPENAVSRDVLLDNVMLYWLTGTGASSARLYWESFSSLDYDPVTVPVGCSIFPEEILRLSRRWAETRFTDLRHWHELERGGHFAALEQPQTFVEELREFFRLVR